MQFHAVALAILTLNGGSGAFGVVPTRMIAMRDLPAPGTPGFYTDDLSRPFYIDESGHVAFRGQFQGPGVIAEENDVGNWSEGGGSLELVARRGNVAPDTGRGVLFGAFRFSFVLSSSGTAAFYARITGTEVDSTNDEGIWSEAEGSLKIVVRKGSAAPGTPNGVVFASLGNPVIGGGGQIALIATLTGEKIDATNDDGIWVKRDGQLSLVARSGSPAPGAGGDVMFAAFGDAEAQPVINSTGRTAFRASLEGVGVDSSNNTGIWSEGNGALALIARSGNDAPGTEEGTVFSGLREPFLNDAGQTAFFGTLIGPAVDDTNAEGLGGAKRHADVGGAYRQSRARN